MIEYESNWTWEQIERIVRKSIRLNGSLSYEEEDLLDRAYLKDRNRYIELHRRISLEGKADVGDS